MNPITRNLVALACLLNATVASAEESSATNWVSKIVHPVRDARTHALLQAIAQEPDPVVRAEVLRAFSVIRDPADAAAVRAALRDPESTVRAQAIATASRLLLTLAPSEAETIAHDPDESVRAAFLVALPGLGIDNKAQFLAGGLEDSSVEVRRAAASAVPQLRVAAGLLGSRWQSERDPLTAQLIYGALLSLTSADARQALILQGLSSTNVAIVVEALRSVQPGDKLAEAVIETLKHPAVIIRQCAVRATQRLADSRLIPALLPLLKSDDSNLRRVVCEALGTIPAETRGASVAALAAQLAHDDDPLVRHAAAEGLTTIHDEAARQALEALLRHDRPALRRNAVLALGQWAAPAVALALHPLLDDPEAGVAAASAEALGTLKSPVSQAPLLQRLASGPAVVQERIAWALGQYRTVEAVPALMKLLTAGNVALETTAAQALGQIGDTRAGPALRKILFDMTHFPEVRRRSIEALRLLGERGELPRVFAIVTERVVPPPPGGSEPSYDSDNVRIEGLRYLAAIGDAPVADRLMVSFKDTPGWEVRVALAEALHTLTGKQYQPVPDEDYRRYSVENLEADFFNQTPPPPGVVVKP